MFKIIKATQPIDVPGEPVDYDESLEDDAKFRLIMSQLDQYLEDMDKATVKRFSRWRNEGCVLKKKPKMYSSKDKIRTFWAANKDKYPFLAAVAREVMGTVATSVSSERNFSLAGDLISKKRSRLKPKTAADLLFLKTNPKLKASIDLFNDAYN